MILIHILILILGVLILLAGWFFAQSNTVLFMTFMSIGALLVIIGVINIFKGDKD